MVVKIKNSSLILISFISLSACLSGGEGIGVRESAAWHQTSTNEAKASYFREICEAYGYEADTEEMASCIERTWGSSRTSAKNKMSSTEVFKFDFDNTQKIPPPIPVVCNRRMVMTRTGCRYP